MPPRVHRYQFGRLHLAGIWDDKREYVLDTLEQEVYESKGNFRYGFFEVQEFLHDGELFVFGQLVKYKQLLEGELVDEDKKQLMVAGLPHGVVGKSNFFLHYDSSVISYRPITNRVSDRQFRSMFAQLFEAAHDGFFVDVAIETVNEELQIRDAMQALDAIDRVTIDLRFPNPDLSSLWRQVGERMRKLPAERLRSTIEAREGGFNKAALEEDEAYKGVMMAADGYGTGTIQGRLNGRTVVIRTEESPVVKEVLDSEDPVQILHQLLPIFRQIWERMRK